MSHGSILLTFYAFSVPATGQFFFAFQADMPVFWKIMEISESGNANFINSLNYAPYASPACIDGVFFLQFTGGLKYYFGK